METYLSKETKEFDDMLIKQRENSLEFIAQCVFAPDRFIAEPTTERDPDR